MKELSIAIVDDNPMVLNTLEGILGQEKDMSVMERPRMERMLFI